MQAGACYRLLVRPVTLAAAAAVTTEVALAREPAVDCYWVKSSPLDVIATTLQASAQCARLGR